LLSNDEKSEEDYYKLLSNLNVCNAFDEFVRIKPAALRFEI
jgi:hypothetical protein